MRVDLHVRHHYLYREFLIKHVIDVNLDISENPLHVEWFLPVLCFIPPEPNMVRRRCKGNPTSLPHHSGSRFIAITITNGSLDSGDATRDAQPIFNELPHLLCLPTREK